MISGIAIISGLVILGFAVYLLIKQVETRAVLLGGGFAMAFVALLLGFIAPDAGMGSPMDAYKYKISAQRLGLRQYLC